MADVLDELDRALARRRRLSSPGGSIADALAAMRGQAAPDRTKAPPKTDLTPIMVGGPAVESGGTAIRPPAFRPPRAPTRTAAPSAGGPAAAPRDAVDELNALLGGEDQEGEDFGPLMMAMGFRAVAARRRDGTIVEGKPGQIHFDLGPIDGEDGFVDEEGKFFTRDEAEEMYKGWGESYSLRGRGILKDTTKPPEDAPQIDPALFRSVAARRIHSAPGG